MILICDRVGVSSDLFPDLEAAAVTEDSRKQLLMVTLLPPEQALCSEVGVQDARQTGHRIENLPCMKVWVRTALALGQCGPNVHLWKKCQSGQH